MINLQNIASFLSTINEWNEKLNAFTGRYADNAIFATATVICLVILGYWGISYLSKK